MEAHLHTLITAHYCRSTHHYIVMDALERLCGQDATQWRRLLLHEHKALLKGAKAPDAEFRDFKNHVLHVGGETEWGGARGAATEWYHKSVAALTGRRWSAAAYALGVLSHYYADPIQPFHTGQTEAEGAVHRALEWSIFKSRPALKARMEALGPVAVRGGDDTNFVSDMVGAGARASHPHYAAFIDHYDLDAGARSPAAGMDETLLDVTAGLLAHAAGGVAHLFERAFAEARVAPARVRLSLDVAVAEIGKPLRAILSKIEDAGTRRAVIAAYEEYQHTGKVIDKLSDDDAAIRALHAREVRGTDLETLDAEAPAPIGTKHGQGATAVEPTKAKAPEAEEPAEARAPQPVAEPQRAPRHERPKTPTLDRVLKELAPRRQASVPVPPPFDEAESTPPAAAMQIEIPAMLAEDKAPDPLAFLDPPSEPIQAASAPRRNGPTEASDVVDAPSIGKRTARHLRRLRVNTIGDLLNADPMDLAERVNQRHITAQAIIDWQDQTRLKMALPSLRVHDVQILVGAGIRSIEDLQSASAAALFEAATLFARTPAAERIIHAADKPTRDEVDGWISRANTQTG